MAKKALVIGIQGGMGSFNEEACAAYCTSHAITPYRIEYLYTTKGVLKALEERKVDRGIFAIENTLGGAVMETINALSEHNCKILDKHTLNISHTLYMRDDADIEKVTHIMSHPQALTQCARTLARLYPKKKRMSGEGKFVDSATALKALSEGKLPKTVAVLAPPVNEGFYTNIKVVKRGLRDKRNNLTIFLFVSRFNGKGRSA